MTVELEFLADGPGKFTAEGALAEGEWIAHVTALRAMARSSTRKDGGFMSARTGGMRP
jgi:nitrogen fixation protein FixH